MRRIYTALGGMRFLRFFCIMSPYGGERNALLAATFYSERGNEMNVKNRTMFIGDNVGFLDNINSECVDLIYLDPPFNSNRNYSAPIGSAAEGSDFKDIWTLDDIDMAWLEVIKDENKALAALLEVVDGFGGKGDKSYLIFMARRLLEMRRILKSTGSIYLHCDQTMSHSLKLVMDCIFGKKNFRNEIVWSYHRFSRQSDNQFAKMNDVILFYSKSANNKYNHLFVDKRDSDPSIKKGFVVRQKDKKVLVYNWGKYNAAIGSLNVEGYAVSDCTDTKVKMGTVWDIPFIHSLAKERTGFRTQKPEALLQRIIKASSKEGDVVMDPFCGCATTLVVAEELNRQWIGIDLCANAINLIHKRLKAAENLWSKVGRGKLLITLHDIPSRTDIPNSDFVNPSKYKATIYGNQSGNCAGCKIHFLTNNLTVDHIVPKSKGGQDTKQNLQLLCGSCNSIKGNRDMAYLMAKLKEDAKK